MLEKQILDLFKVMVIRPDAHLNSVDMAYANKGFITDFLPTEYQLSILFDAFKPLDMKTFFTVEERQNSDAFDLLYKQVLHYIEVYGLGMPGLFDIPLGDGKVISLSYVRGVSEKEFHQLVTKLLYSNAPVKDADIIKQIVEQYNIGYNINSVANNELRVALYNVERDKFNNGDDVVRWLCYKATGNTLLIKSPEVIAQITAMKFDPGIFEKHVYELAQVFNRHKRLIIAAKRGHNRTVINKIARLSKTAHVPLHEPISKRFIRLALTDQISDFSVLDKISVRDKFKFLNLLEYKKEQLNVDAFVIRNGKVHLEQDRPVYAIGQLTELQDAILDSLSDDLAHLKGAEILLDPQVDYGLPISRKQTIGNLPFGTTVSVDGKEISSGVYWQNDWGATDLDLSTIDTSGNRTGWGVMSGYDSSYEVTFSGDVTYAPEGAMEFMTSSVKAELTYGLFINIFAGNDNCQMEMVVGTKTDKQWIGEAIIREKHTLSSKNGIIGFVKDGKYVVYTGRLGGHRVSGGSKSQAMIAKGTANFWTVKHLLDKIGIKYTEKRKDDIDYEYDLSYKGFTYDKLENLLLQK